MIFFSFKPVNEYITRIFDLRTISFRSKAEATLNVFFSNELTILRQICKISRQITKVQRKMRYIHTVVSRQYSISNKKKQTL